jgi:hypothetical protein
MHTLDAAVEYWPAMQATQFALEDNPDAML